MPTGAIGMLVGGYLVKRFKLMVPGIIKFCIACNIVVIGVSMSYLARCDDVTFVGLNVGYNGQAIDSYVYFVSYYCF